MAKAPDPTFEVRFVAPGLHPEEVPLHAVSEALAAIQDIASGRDPLETRHVPQEKSIGLLKVRRGSAVYSCVSRAPDEARRNLKLVGKMVSTLDVPGTEADLMVSAFSPIKTLSLVARNLNCQLEVYPAGNREKPLLTVEAGDFEKLSSRLLLKGDTTVVGTVVRAGGATDMRCLMRVPGRRRLLYCNVENRKLVRQLGQHLYEQIAAVGTAVWIHRSWYILGFTVRSFTQPKIGSATQAIARLRDAGLKAWDNIPNPEDYMKEQS